MVITALSDATIHLLGSAQVLTTPTSLIKELVDNALDAKSTAIDVLITPDTLSKLEVRDNGHGIPPEDLDALGKRGHTSKLRSFEELRFLGGITLGFRGEALASAVQLGDVSITTKTDGEPVAISVKLDVKGGIKQRSLTSHPVGTSVTVINFASKLPVRKKTFEKEAPKTIQAIKRLLQAYAMARPSVKFSLKVSKGGKGSWSYAPRASDGIGEAVSQVVGRDTALQCTQQSLKFQEPKYKQVLEAGGDDLSDLIFDTANPQRNADEVFTMEAFLPKPGADPSALCKGQYLSIDSRPVSHEKGTMKKVVTLFKKYIRGTFRDNMDKLKNPFLRLNIKCPSASYDANVEPAKDNVLFGNEDLILESMEQLLKTIYGNYNTALNPLPATVLPNKLDGFEILLARKSRTFSSSITRSTPFLDQSSSNSVMIDSPDMLSTEPMLWSSSGALSAPRLLPVNDQERPQTSHAAESELPLEEEGQFSKNSKWAFDMSKDYTEEREGYERWGSTGEITLCQGFAPIPASKSSLNPWLIAKMNAPLSRDLRSSFQSLGLPIQEPEICSDKRPAANRPRQTSQTISLAVSQSAIEDLPSLGPEVPYPNKKSLPARGVSQSHDIHDGRLGANETPAETLCRNDFVTARYAPEPEAHLMSPPSTVVAKNYQVTRGTNKPFGHPLRTKPSSAHTAIRSALATKHQPSAWKVIDNHTTWPEPENDLVWAMDYEQRKEEVNQHRREERRNARTEKQFERDGTNRSSPHRNRYNAAVTVLEAARTANNASREQPKEQFKTSLTDDDPRAYLMRRNKSMHTQSTKPGDPPRTLRTKSMKLPLETIRSNESLHQLLRETTTDLEALKRITKTLSREDAYIGRGCDELGLAMEDSHILLVANGLGKAVECWIAHTAGEKNKYEVEFSFGDLPNLSSEDDVVRALG